MLKRITSPTVLTGCLAALWTLLICYLMLSPGSGTVADDVSQAFGGTELSDSLGHAALAFIETLLLSAAFRPLFSGRRALWAAAAFTLALTAALELSQRWIPDRSASPLDVAVNALGVALCVAFVYLSGFYAGRPANPA